MTVLTNTLLKTRLAIGVIYFALGFNLTNLSARLPELKALYGVSDSVLGLMLLCVALGGVVATSILASSAIQIRPQTYLLISSLSASMLLAISPLLTLNGTAFILFFLYGIMDGTKEIIINQQAVALQQYYAKPIMSGFYAIYSCSLVAGAATGWLFESLHISLFFHMLLAGLLCVLLIIMSIPYLSSEYLLPPDTESILPKNVSQKLVLLLGGIAFCGMHIDSGMSDWSVLFTLQNQTSDQAASALSLTWFTGGTALGRLTGDYFTHRLGEYRLLSWNGIVTSIGIIIILLAPTLLIVYVGFFIAGVGVSTVIPLAYSLAGQSASVSRVAQIGYAAYFITPPIIGILGDWFSLRAGFMLMFSCLLLMLVLVKASRILCE